MHNRSWEADLYKRAEELRHEAQAAQWVSDHLGESQVARPRRHWLAAVGSQLVALGTRLEANYGAMVEPSRATAMGDRATPC